MKNKDQDGKYWSASNQKPDCNEKWVVWEEMLLVCTMHREIRNTLARYAGVCHLKVLNELVRMVT
jgi:hypothetical protein